MDQVIAAAAGQTGRSFRGLDYPFGQDAPAPGTVTDVGGGVLWLRMPLPMASLNHINLYVLDGGDSWTIVDTGLRFDAIRSLWEQLLAGPLAGKPVAQVVATHFHPDHLGMAGWLCARTGARLCMSRTEYYFAALLINGRLPEPPQEALDYYHRAGWGEADLAAFRARGWGNFSKAVHPLPHSFRRLKDGDTLTVGAARWRVVIGSGHSPEHVCLVSDEAGVMISGDQVLPRITSNVSVTAMEPEANPLRDWLDSIGKLRSLRPDLLVLPAHGEPFLGLHTRLDQLVADHDRKLEALLQHCATPRTVVDCFEALFRRRVTVDDIMTATGEAMAHLNYLKYSGHVTESSDGAVAVYSAV